MNDLESVANARDDLLATINLEVCHPNSKLIIIVEGVDDTKIYNKLFKDDFSIYTFKDGCESVKQVVLETFAFEKKVIGIIDSDFYHNLSGGYPLQQKLFMTDLHDIEMIMISDKKTFKKILIEHNIKKDENKLKTEIFLYIKYFSLLKFYNEYFGKGLRINKELVDHDEIDPFISKCIERNSEKNLQHIEINQFITDKSSNDPYCICNGHDFCFGLTKLLGITSSIKMLESQLRIGYRRKAFKKTSLYGAIIKYLQTL